MSTAVSAQKRNVPLRGQRWGLSDEGTIGQKPCRHLEEEHSQVEGTAGTKARRWEHARWDRGTAGRPPGWSRAAQAWGWSSPQEPSHRDVEFTLSDRRPLGAERRRLTFGLGGSDSERGVPCCLSHSSRPKDLAPCSNCPPTGTISGAPLPISAKAQHTPRTFLCHTSCP